MNQYSIPGVVYKLAGTRDRNSYRINISLHGDRVSSANITAISEKGVRKAIQEVVNKVGIDHQITPSVIDELAVRMIGQFGFHRSSGQAMSDEDKLAIIIEKLMSIDARLERIQKELMHCHE